MAGAVADLDELELEAIAAYQEHCPADASAFRPLLCENGESVVVGAVREVRARLGLE